MNKAEKPDYEIYCAYVPSLIMEIKNFYGQDFQASREIISILEKSEQMTTVTTVIPWSLVDTLSSEVCSSSEAKKDVIKICRENVHVMFANFRQRTGC